MLNLSDITNNHLLDRFILFCTKMQIHSHKIYISRKLSIEVVAPVYQVSRSIAKEVNVCGILNYSASDLEHNLTICYCNIPIHAFD